MSIRTWLATAALALLAAGQATAQTRVITGRVTDSLTKVIVNTGQVSVQATTIGTSIKDDGTFTLAVPTRDVVLTVRSIGFKRRDVAVPTSQNSVQVGLERDYFQLEAIVVTGQATGVEKKNLANAVSTVTATEMAKVSSATLETALAGKLAGVSFQETSGAPGGGVRVRLRGTTSIIGGGTPLYVVDGVIVSDARIEGGMNAVSLAQNTGISGVQQMAPVNHIGDLNPNDIDNVEVLKGSSAAAIYGSKAANGVVLITTKRGRVGAPRFQVRQGIGTAMRAFTYGSRYFTSLADATVAFGPLSATYWSQGYTAHSLEDDITGHKPLQYETSASMSGGTENTQYFASALIRHEGGIALHTFGDKASVRLNIDQSVGSRLKLSAGTEVIRTANDRGMFGNDNAGTSYYFVVPHHPNYFDLRATCPDGTRQVECDGGVYPADPFVASNPLQSAVLMKRDEIVWRVLTTGRASLDAISTPQQTLRFIVNGGFDQFTQENGIVSPPELFFEPNDGLPGTVVRSFGSSLNNNVNANAVHTFRSPGGGLSATTQVGTQYESSRLLLDRTAAKGLAAGTPSIQGASQVQVEQQFERVRDFGVFAQEEVLLSDRLLLTLGLRADRSSNNSDTKKFFYYPKASASYRLSNLGPMSELKLRAAFGQTGNRPLYGQKFTNLATTNVGGVTGVRINPAAGAALAKPERQTEFEGGFDGQLAGGRALLEFTVYQKVSKDLLLQRTLAPVTGFTSEVFNSGTELRVRGIELGLTLTPIRASNTTWTANLNWSLNRSTITKLPVPAFNVAGGTAGAIRLVQGGSATALWSNDTVPGGAGQLIFKYQTDAAPAWNGGFINTIQHKSLSLSSSVDIQRGGRVNLGTWRHWDQSRNGYDWEFPGPNGELLGNSRLIRQGSVPMNYWRNAGYVKLREVTLGFDLPRSFTQSVWSGIRNARLSVSGRNLVTLTGIIGGDFFKGNDPAVANYHSGEQQYNNVEYSREFAAYPSARSFWFSIDLGF